MDIQNFCPRQFQQQSDLKNKKKTHFLEKEGSVTRKRLNGEGDNIYFESIAVFWLL